MPRKCEDSAVFHDQVRPNATKIRWRAAASPCHLPPPKIRPQPAQRGSCEGSAEHLKGLRNLKVLDDLLNVLGGFDASLESLGVYIVHIVGSNE